MPRRGRYEICGLNQPEYCDTAAEAGTRVLDLAAAHRDRWIEAVDRRTKLAIARLPRQDRCAPGGMTPAEVIGWLAIQLTFPIAGERPPPPERSAAFFAAAALGAFR